MSIEAMKQALEALKWINDEQAIISYEAITALHTAIEQAEKQKRNFCERCGKRLGGADHIHTCTPPQTRPATREEKIVNPGVYEVNVEQEPVACRHNRYSVDVHEQTGTCYDCGAEGRMRFVVGDTTPPKREWVGLTDEERFEVADISDCFEDVVDAVEAKLKEKNT